MSKQVTPPPPGDKPSPSAPPPPPTWRHWLWPIAIVIALGLWIALPAVHTNLAGHAELLRVHLEAGRAPGQDDLPGAERADEHRDADGREGLHHGHPGPGGLVAAEPAPGGEGPGDRGGHRALRSARRSCPGRSSSCRCCSSAGCGSGCPVTRPASCRASWAWAGPGPRCSTPSGPPPGSPTSPGTTARSGKFPRSWTSSRSQNGTAGPARPRPAACSWSGRPEPARPCSPGPWRVRRRCRSSPWPAPASWSCSSASAPPASATCSARRASAPRPSSSSTRSTRSGSAARAARCTPPTTSASRPSTSCCPRWTASTPPWASSCSPRRTVPRCWTRRCCVPAGSTGRSRSRCRT